MHPVGIRLRSHNKWTFEILAEENIDIENALAALPNDAGELICDINAGLSEYRSNISPYLMSDRIDGDALKCQKSIDGRYRNKTEVIKLIELGRFHELLELSRISILMKDNCVISVFDYECPVEEYLQEYGFSLIKGKTSLGFTIRDVCWNLRLERGGLID